MRWGRAGDRDLELCSLQGQPSQQPGAGRGLCGTKCSPAQMLAPCPLLCLKQLYQGDTPNPVSPQKPACTYGDDCVDTRTQQCRVIASPQESPLSSFGNSQTLQRQDCPTGIPHPVPLQLGGRCPSPAELFIPFLPIRVIPGFTSQQNSLA